MEHSNENNNARYIYPRDRNGTSARFIPLAALALSFRRIEIKRIVHLYEVATAH